MLRKLRNGWMAGVKRTEAFRGKLSGKQSNEKTPYIGAVIRLLMNPTEILKKYKDIS
jgi:hypothetical protein